MTAAERRLRRELADAQVYQVQDAPANPTQSAGAEAGLNTSALANGEFGYVSAANTLSKTDATTMATCGALLATNKGCITYKID